MAKSIVPTDWIPNYSSDGTNITFPIASLSGLTQAQAHTSTGNIKAIVMAFLKTIKDKQEALAAADKLTKMAPTRNDTTNTSTGAVTANFYVPIICDAPTLVPAAED